MLGYLLLVLIFSSVSAVTIYPDTIIFANGFTLMHKTSCDYTFVDVEMNYTILDSHNITYITNISSSHNLIERDGHYNLGNYTTTISIDVYKPNDWTVNKFYMEFYTNNSYLENKTIGFTITTVNSTHKRYAYNYNPSNDLTKTDMGPFDVNIYVNASNNTLYYYGNRTYNDLFSVYVLDPPYNGSSTWNTTTYDVNLTWNRGNHSDTDVVIRKNSSINPISPTDGYIVYNGTLGWFNESATTTRSYTVFSFNATTHSWSEGLPINWGALGIWVYNASKTWQQVDPYGIQIQNQLGTQTYVNTIAGTPLYLDLNDIPIGVNTIFIINSTGYKTQTYTRDTSYNVFYNYSFLIPPITTPGGGTPEENNTYIYLITVNNELNQAVADALVTIKIYKNQTDSYEQVFSFLTDGAGQVSSWLMPNHLYQVIITKTGYNQMLTYWTPSHLIFTKTFQITSTAIIPQPPIVSPEDIHFTVTLVNDNTTIQAYYLDETNFTIWTTLDVSVFNYSTNSFQHIGTYTNTTEQTWIMSFNNINRSNDYYFNLSFNNQYLGTSNIQRIIEAEVIKPWTPGGISGRFDWMGIIPFGVMNFLMWLLLIAVLYYADSRDAGKMVIVYGIICIGLTSFFGILAKNIFLLGNGVSVSIFFIIMGFLIERRK